MCHLLGLPIDQLKEHGICDVQACELLQCGRGKDDFAAVVDVVALCARKHSCRIAAVILIEFSERASSSAATLLKHIVHGIGVVASVEVRVELGGLA